MTTVTRHRARLGDLLVSRGSITLEQLEHALETQRQGQQEKLLGEILVDLEYTTPDEVLSAVAEGCGVPFAALTPAIVDPDARSALPDAFLRKHGVLPLFCVRGVLTVATSEPANVFLVDEIAHASGKSVQVIAATAENILEMLEQTRSDDVAAAAPDVEADLTFSQDVLQPEDFDSVYGTWPADKVAALLVREAVRSRADAIHLEPEEKVLRVRFRIDGALHVITRPPMRVAPGLSAALAAMAEAPRPDDRAEPQAAATRLTIDGQGVQLRYFPMEGAFGTRAIVRLVCDNQAQRPLEKLGCDFDLLQRYKDLVAGLHGIVLLAGPRESGLTTALYSTLHALDPVRLNVCTFEDSIAYRLSGINQFSPATTGLPNAAAAIARLLQQQPDVLVIDASLDTAAWRAVADVARDGLLVLARTWAVDASDAIARLAAHVPPADLAAVLAGVLAQRLVRTVCPDCRASCETPAPLRRRIPEALGPVETSVKGRGCLNCRRTGFVGRIGLFELVPWPAPLLGLLEEKAPLDALRQAARSQGCLSLWSDGLNKVKAGITSLEEVLEVLAGCPDSGRPADSLLRRSSRFGCEGRKPAGET